MKVAVPFLSLAIVSLAVTALAQQPGQQVQSGQPAQPGQGGQFEQQQPGQPQTREARRPVIDGQVQAQSGSPDAKIAACLLIGNEVEVWLGELGKEQAKSDDVKQFAEKMVEDHTKLWQQLARFAPEGQRGEAEATGQARAGQQQPAGNRPFARRARGQAGQGGQSGQAGRSGQADFVQMKREISKECFNMVRDELNEKEGADFDKCFVSLQIGNHIEMLAALKVSRQHAGSGELQQVIEQGIETTQNHLDQAKELMKSLEKESASS